MLRIRTNLPPEWDENQHWYYEPFLGGGAVLLELQPSRVVIGDTNKDLMNLYSVVRKGVDTLIELLQSDTYVNTKENYYRIRELDRSPEYGDDNTWYRAARFLYLNRTGWQGLCRYNKAGQLNMPYGHYKTVNYDFENLKAVSKYLNGVKILREKEDWQEALTSVKAGAFVYLDPPYDPLSATAKFTEYSPKGFTKADQADLKLECDRLTKLGAYVMKSNAATPFILDLYRDYKQIVFPVTRATGVKKGKKEAVGEVLIMNYVVKNYKSKLIDIS